MYLKKLVLFVVTLVYWSIYCRWVSCGLARSAIFNRLQREKDRYCPVDELWIKPAHNEIHCQIICNMESSCYRIAFNTKTKECHGHGSSSTDVSCKKELGMIQYTKDCGTILTSSKGTLTSPNYPEKYPNYQLCNWYITVPQGRRITFTFDGFHVGHNVSDTCFFDYLSIYGGWFSSVKEIGRYCGVFVPTKVVTPRNTARVVFKSSRDGAHEGFRIFYESST